MCVHSITDGVFHVTMDVILVLLPYIFLFGGAVSSYQPCYPWSSSVVTIPENEANASSESPMQFLTVTDNFRNRWNSLCPGDLNYTIIRSVAPNKFRVDPQNGTMSLIGSLDRDPPGGRDEWWTAVYVQCNMTGGLGCVATAVLRLTDVNDNAPTFETGDMVAITACDRAKGGLVYRAVATDPDLENNGSVIYELRHNYTEISFDISDSGIITCQDLSGNLQAVEGNYTLEVVGRDNGTFPLQSSLSLLVIVDTNDTELFSERLYQYNVSESTRVGQIVDWLRPNGLAGFELYDYFLLLEKDPELFDIRSYGKDGAALVLIKELDFDQALETVFNVSVAVEISSNFVTRSDTTTVELTVYDENDNAPVISPRRDHIVLKEDTLPGTNLTIYTASDIDSGINREFSFAIDKMSDPQNQFSIDPISGQVRTLQNLDREQHDFYSIRILAIDKGRRSRTGEAILEVTVEDINDNYPQIIQSTTAVFQNDPVGTELIVLNAIDPDSGENGEASQLSLLCDGACPCEESPDCQLFWTIFERDGVPRARVFLAKDLRYPDVDTRYILPIVATDSGTPTQSGTSTLTITVWADTTDSCFDIDVGRIYSTDATKTTKKASIELCMESCRQERTFQCALFWHSDRTSDCWLSEASPATEPFYRIIGPNEHGQHYGQKYSCADGGRLSDESKQLWLVVILGLLGIIACMSITIIFLHTKNSKSARNTTMLRPKRGRAEMNQRS